MTTIEQADTELRTSLAAAEREEHRCEVAYWSYTPGTAAWRAAARASGEAHLRADALRKALERPL